TLVFPQQVARIDRQVRQPVRGSVEEALNRHLRHLIPQVDAVLVSDYKSGVVTPPLLDTARSQARRLHKLITADSQGDLHNFAGFDVVKSNRRETERTLGRSLEKEADFRWATELLLDELGAQAVLITRGGEGMSLASREEGYLHIPAANRSEVFDVTGAGDTVIAVLTLALAAGATVLQAAHLANHAAGLVVRRLGNVAPTPEELAWAIENW
ncbi:MAG TPA: ribokinase, partial [Anaerolineae bacterium]|nr:ribokinase [Anaerolineae bacterium]